MTQMSRTEFKELYRSRKDFVPPRNKKRADARRQVEIINELRELGLSPKRDASMSSHLLEGKRCKKLSVYPYCLYWRFC